MQKKSSGFILHPQGPNKQIFPVKGGSNLINLNKRGLNILVYLLFWFREEGLLNNLSLMFNKWILPPPPRKKKTRIQILKEKFTFRHLSKDYWTNNIPLISFIIFIIIMNLILFIQRVVYFKVIMF